MSANPNGQRMPREARVRQVRELRDQGLLLREIADRLGISVSVVGDCLTDPTGEKARERRHKRHGLCVDCGAKTFSGGSIDVPRRCRSCALVDQGTIEWRRKQSALLLGAGRRWTDEQILAAIRRASRNGTVSQPMYESAYERAPRGTMPSLPLIGIRFEFWSRAVAAAGLRPTRREWSGPYRGRLTAEGAVLAVEECTAEIGHLPTYAEYEQWAKAVGGPSAKSVRLRCGSWMAAINAADAAQRQAA